MRCVAASLFLWDVEALLASEVLSKSTYFIMHKKKISLVDEKSFFIFFGSFLLIPRTEICFGY